MDCRHPHGDTVPVLGYWLCGVCYAAMEKRPYHIVRTKIPPGPRGSEPPQKIIYRPSKASPEGLTLADFLRGMAKRFERRSDCTPIEAMEAAVQAVRDFGEEFGDPAFEWSASGAADIADEAMCEWEQAGAGN